jgi:hypothetical protein
MTSKKIDDDLKNGSQLRKREKKMEDEVKKYKK